MLLSFKHLNHRTLFKALSGNVAKGQCLQIHGGNGSGKTTLLRILALLIEPEEGEIHWQNSSAHENRLLFQQQLHYVGHLNGIKANLTVTENLQFFAALNNITCLQDEIKIILEKIKLKPHQLALELSAGQKRRLSLAKLLLKRLPLWILDEPTTALDSNGQQWFAELLDSHLKNQGLAVIATHQALTLPGNTLHLGSSHV